MSNSEAARYSSGEYLERYPTWHVEDSVWKATCIHGILKRHELHPAAVADVGCGAGEVLRQLKLRLPPDTELTGYDVSSHAIALARAREDSGISFVEGQGVEQDGRRFDLVLAIDLIEHLENPFEFLRRLRARAPLAIFHIPLDLFALAALLNRPLNGWRTEVGHLHAFTRDLALLTLAAAGWRSTDWSYTPSSFVSPSNDPKTRLLQSVRRAAFRARPDLAVRTLGGYSLLVFARSEAASSEDGLDVRERAAS